MYRDRLKWASFPCWYKTGIGNFVLPRLGLCSLKRWFILIHFSIFSDLAIIFSWVDIILSSLTAFVQGGKSPEITGQAFLTWFQWGFVYSLPESWCLYSLLSLCQPPSWGFFFSPHPSSTTTPLFSPASSTSQSELMGTKDCYCAFVFLGTW